MGSYSYEPSGRFSFRFSGNVDEQASELATTTAALATAFTSAEVVRGLTLTGTGVWGTRGQMLGITPVTVVTRSGVAGIAYQAGGRWLNGTASLTRGVGSNTTPEGLRGGTESWSREASLSSTMRWLGLGAGYERVMNRDAILDYGNYDSERVRASIDTLGSRASLSTNAEQLRITRGAGLTFAANLQKTFSSSVSFRVWRQSQITASAGGLVNDYANAIGIGRDRALFWSVGSQLAVMARLQASAWIRSEFASASKTGYTQEGLSALGRLEYRLRAFRVAAEYRHVDEPAAIRADAQPRQLPRPSDPDQPHQTVWREAAMTRRRAFTDLTPAVVAFVAVAVLLSVATPRAQGAAGSSRRANAVGSRPTWPPPPEPARIRFLRTLNPAAVRGRPSLFSRFVSALTGGDAPPSMSQPYGIAVGPDRRIYVADTRRRTHSRLQPREVRLLLDQSRRGLARRHRVRRRTGCSSPTRPRAVCCAWTRRVERSGRSGRRTGSRVRPASPRRRDRLFVVGHAEAPRGRRQPRRAP